jgi:hypothetical protein
VTNPTREPKPVTITLIASAGEFQSAQDVWGNARITQAGRQFTMNVPARDAVVAMLR